MSFSFYPRHEHNCPNVSHCPHLGGAALGTLVLLANEQELSRRALHATIDAERARGDRLFAETERLQKELDQVKLELKLERQNKFATNKQKQDSGDTAAAAADSTTASTKEKKKRGAPVSHPGWFRKTPKAYDWAVDVAAPKRCPHCDGAVNVFDEAVPTEHPQEDIIDGCYRVVLYRHEAARCEDCGKLVQKAGDGEILNSRIGPHLRSKATYLRNVIGISYRKIPQAIEELFKITFTPAALIGFESMLADKAKPTTADSADFRFFDATARATSTIDSSLSHPVESCDNSMTTVNICRSHLAANSAAAIDDRAKAGLRFASHQTQPAASVEPASHQP